MNKRSKEYSLYKQLHTSIDSMFEYGESIEDEHVIRLATELKRELNCLETDPSHNQPDVKNKFRIVFLERLHSEDARFIRDGNHPIKTLQCLVHKSLYVNLYPGVKQRIRNSLFQEKPTIDRAQSNPLKPL